MFPLYMFSYVSECVPVEITDPTLVVSLSVVSENIFWHKYNVQNPVAGGGGGGSLIFSSYVG